MRASGPSTRGGSSALTRCRHQRQEDEAAAEKIRRVLIGSRHVPVDPVHEVSLGREGLKFQNLVGEGLVEAIQGPLANEGQHQPNCARIAASNRECTRAG